MNANIVGRNVAFAGRINDVGTGRMLHMFAPRPVTLFATHIPFCHRLGSDVIIYRVATVAECAGRTLKIIRRI